MAREAQGLTQQEVQRWSHVGALSAMALLLGYLETFVPIPIPGVKLGLANIPVLIALAQGDAAGACWIGVIKVLAAGLLFGNPVTMAYSTLGTALSLAVMVPLSRLQTMRLWMVSVVGAMAHEVGQLLVAQALLGTSLVWYGAGPLLLAGCAMGLFSGVMAVRTCQLIDEDSGGEPLAPGETASIPARPEPVRRVNPRVALVALAVFSVVTLRATDLIPLFVCLSLSVGACLYAQVTWRDLLRALRPVVLILGITLVAQLFANQGQVNLALTQALVSGLRLLSLVGASLAFMRVQTTSDLLQSVTWVLSPLKRLGLSIEGPLLALDVTLQLLPQLASAFTLERGRHLRDVIPQLAADIWRRASSLQ